MSRGANLVRAVIELEDVSASATDSALVLDQLGVEVGDEIEHILFRMVLGAATNWSATFQVKDIDGAYQDLLLWNGSAGVHPLPQADSSASFNNSLVPGHADVGPLMHLVVMPEMQLEIDWTSPAVDSESHIWIEVTEPFG